MIATDDPNVAFKDIDVAILVGAMPRREGMERKDLLKANAKIFETQGKAIDTHAKRTVKVRLITGDERCIDILSIELGADSWKSCQY